MTLLEVAVRIARACVETDPKRRPRMQEVYRTLVSEIQVPALFKLAPLYPLFSLHLLRGCPGSNKGDAFLLSGNIL